MKKSLALLSTFGVGLSLISASQAQTIKVDGSSTVFPLTEAVAEDFGKANPSVRVTVGVSGTGGGFKKFAAGETDISNASRPIKASEANAARAKGINFIELPVAYDALTVVVNKNNTWASSITKAELKKIWEPGSKIKTWKQVRASWPNRPLKLYGAGTDSGTFDYFTEAVNGKERASRSDYTASEDDNTLVQGVSRDVNAMGYFGMAYYEENKDKLKALAIDNGKGAVYPSATTVNNGSYQPLARPLFIYVSSKSAKNPTIAKFVRYYLTNAPKLAKQVGYVGLPANIQRLAVSRFNSKKPGSVFGGGGSTVGVRLADLLRRTR